MSSIPLGLQERRDDVMQVVAPPEQSEKPRKWNLRVCFGLTVWLGVICIALLATPSLLWDEQFQHVVFVVGGIGLWRFGWWANHVVRAIIYGRYVYPRMRAAGERAWARGEYPQRVHFMVTTFRERPEVTTAVVRSIFNELRTTGLSGIIWLGSGEQADEDIYERLVLDEAADLPLELVISRQDRPGKRYAIGMSLRAIYRSNIKSDEIVVFMDGDSIIVPGMLQKCLPLFSCDPELGALTTDELVFVTGPRWVSNWLSMRFAQRRVGMQSHALAGKVLTLTGRLSLFRAGYMTDREFIEMIEEDSINNWLWGRFRFLSGDDKSTWYHLLSKGARMIYVPDAYCLTLEHIEGSGYDRMVHNLRRWSGNMLRNGSRAIALGPRRVGLFTWWSLVDQRIAMWTMLVSPLLALSASVFASSIFVPTYITWILVTRFVQSLVLWVYSSEVILSYPIYLYTNQMLNAAVKVYCLFRLSKQRWANRGDQKSGFEMSFTNRARSTMAGYLTFVTMLGLFIAIVSYAGFVQTPTLYTVEALVAELNHK